MKIEHFVFVESMSNLPGSLRKFPEAFGLTTSNSLYPNNFNIEENLNYLGPFPDVWYYGADEMSKGKRSYVPTVRVVIKMNGDTMAEFYERTIARIEQIARAGYKVHVQWE